MRPPGASAQGRLVTHVLRANADMVHGGVLTLWSGHAAAAPLCLGVSRLLVGPGVRFRFTRAFLLARHDHYKGLRDRFLDSRDPRAAAGAVGIFGGKNSA